MDEQRLSELLIHAERGIERKLESVAFFAQSGLTHRAANLL